MSAPASMPAGRRGREPKASTPSPSVSRRRTQPSSCHPNSPLKSREPRGATPRGPAVSAGAARYFFSIFRRSISFLSASRFITLNSTRRFFDMLSADVFGTSGRLEP